MRTVTCSLSRLFSRAIFIFCLFASPFHPRAFCSLADFSQGLTRCPAPNTAYWGGWPGQAHLQGTGLGPATPSPAGSSHPRQHSSQALPVFPEPQEISQIHLAPCFGHPAMVICIFNDCIMSHHRGVNFKAGRGHKINLQRERVL